MNLTDEQIAALSKEFEAASAADIIWWAVARFPERLAVTSSFQSQSVPLLHLIGRLAPRVPVLFLDTGFHFPETLEFRDALARRLRLSLRNLPPLSGHEAFRERHGTLHEKNPSMCCYLNKVEPLHRSLDQFDAWISGIRRDQTAQRQSVSVLSRDDSGRVKVCPLAAWDASMVERYRRHHRLPEHPLADRGFRSIGCAPCTRATAAGEDPRAGRWSGSEKTECGLHYDDK